MYHWTYSDEDLQRAIVRGQHERAKAFSGAVDGAVAGIVWLVAAGIAAAVRLARAIRDQIARHRAIGELQRLDGRLLKDIGIDRSEIVSVVDALQSPDGGERIRRGQARPGSPLRRHDLAARVPFVRPAARPATNDNATVVPLGHAQPRTACG